MLPHIQFQYLFLLELLLFLLIEQSDKVLLVLERDNLNAQDWPDYIHKGVF
jgi:hypothetical protein